MMPTIPAHHIAILAGLYAAEYFWRAWQVRERRYMYIGKAVVRTILAAVYFWFALMPAEAEVRSVWIRWSLFMFLAVDLFFAAQEHFIRKVIQHA
jgi:hypothetical protein